MKNIVSNLEKDRFFISFFFLRPITKDCFKKNTLKVLSMKISYEFRRISIYDSSSIQHTSRVYSQKYIYFKQIKKFDFFNTVKYPLNTIF